MTDIFMFHGLSDLGVFFVCILLFFVACFAMLTIVGVAEAIERAVKTWIIERRKKAFAPLRESRDESRPVVDKQKLLNWVGMHADTSDPRGFTVKVNDLQNAIRAGEFKC